MYKIVESENQFSKFYLKLESDDDLDLTVGLEFPRLGDCFESL